MPRTSLLLVTYDVSSGTLRRRLARLLEGYGARVQRSVFECPLRPAEHEALLRQLRALMADHSDRADSVRCYRLGLAAAERVTILGAGRLTADVPFLVA